MKGIEQVIKEQLDKQKKQPEELVTLVLDSTCKSTHVKGLDAFVNLKSLSLCSLGLTSLEGFPKLPNLVHLNLSDNRITGGLQHLVDAGLTSLRTLELANNRLARLSDLEPLKSLPALQVLDVDACPLTRTPDYSSDKVFAMLDELKYLDSYDRKGNERDGDEEEDFDEEGGEEEFDAEGGGEEEYEDEEGGEFEEEDEKEYAILVGPDAIGEDEEGDYQDEGEGDDEDEGEDEDEGAAQGTKRKREEEEEEEDEGEEGDE
ncbi:hypothetical protein Agub_g14720 [Astrephomene gubernaculifera]|uniref:Acidic leucine-rich nuclear phosphoprotein 32 family member E n=1 Tax=Astrephomene gubernaculifera TaxID=47775 RepID=A0AAD3E2F3_9CHLO|nr:hypothetical protein Agub_g14720 [Astrephomene gubernaculifera]